MTATDTALAARHRHAADPAWRRAARRAAGALRRGWGAIGRLSAGVAEYLEAQLFREPADPGRDALTLAFFSDMDLTATKTHLGRQMARLYGCVPHDEIRRCIDTAFAEVDRIAAAIADGAYTPDGAQR